MIIREICNTVEWVAGKLNGNEINGVCENEKLKC